MKLNLRPLLKLLKMHVKWHIAMAEEFNALIKTGTWTLVPKTPSMNIVGAKWVICIKHKADGSVERYKASAPCSERISPTRG